MARPSATGENDPPAGDSLGLEEPLQPVRAGGPGRPVALVVVTAAILATLVWQPWGGAVPRAAPPAPPAAVLHSAAPVDSPAPPSPTPTLRGPRPSFGGAPLTSGTYISLGDNTWSVVALLAPEPLAAADQRWRPDATGALQAPGGPLLVLQLGPTYSERPIDRPDDPGAVCRTKDTFRDYATAHLPADRVAYLGVTFPGMDPRAKVTGVVLDRRGLALKRVPVVTVPLSGMTEGRRYTVPTTGFGGAALFALAPRTIMPTAAYRFDIQIPGAGGHRYLYACIDP
jgi:hypothetical protein